MSSTPDEARSRGRIERRGSNLRVVVYAGIDPVTGRRAYLRALIKGSDRAAQRKATSTMNKLIARVEEQQAIG